MAKRKRKLGSRTLAVVVLIIVLIVASMLLYGWFALGKTPAETFNYFAAMLKGGGSSGGDYGGSHTSNVFDESTVRTVSDGDFSVHFLEPAIAFISAPGTTIFSSTPAARQTVFP